jgi:tetratricopeptide (TPR) repeat protein
MPIIKKRAMNTFLHRYSALLLLLCIFAATRIGYGQTRDYASLTNAGRAEYWAGHFEEAERLLRSALEAALRTKDDHAVAAAYGDLGAVYQNEERPIEAERAYLEALRIFRRFPDKNFETATLLRNLASVYSLDRRDSEALQALGEASKLLKKNTPEEQALAAQLQNSLGMVYYRQGKMSKAEPLLAQAIAMRSLAGGDSDVTDAQILNNLGAIYQKQRKYAKAEESYKRSLEITERRLGPVHPYLTWTLSNLAELYTEMRRYKETEDQYRRSLSILEQMSPVPNARIAQTLYWLGQNYLQQGDKARTESVLAQAVEIARRNPQPDLEMPALLDAHADSLKSLGKNQESQLLYAEARRMRLTMALTVREPKPK